MYEKFKRKDLNIISLDIGANAYVFLNEHWKYDNACDPFSRLYFVRKGKGFLKSDEGEIELKGGYVYLIPANYVFSYGCESLEKIYFHVSVSTLEKYDVMTSVKKICAIPFGEDEFNILLDCYLSDNYFDLMKLKKIIYETILKCEKKYKFEKRDIREYSETVNKIMTFIHENGKINLSVADISKKLFISESKVRNDFKRETGKNIGEYIDEYVFVKAKKMLGREENSIKDVSVELGFCDQFYFSRRFKQRYGQTPSEYKKEIHNLYKN